MEASVDTSEVVSEAKIVPIISADPEFLGPGDSISDRRSQGNLARTPDVAVVTPLNNFLGPEGDTVTTDKHY